MNTSEVTGIAVDEQPTSQSGGLIDLRSDTVTKPTAAMRAAMANADVGDDAFGEDPTVQLLERTAADMFGKPAAIFVPTGTMGNTIAVKLQTHHGDEIICAERSHIVDGELGIVSWFCGCAVRQVPTASGTLTWRDVEAVVNPRRPIYAPSTLIVLEHPHNMAGGRLYPLEGIDEICKHAHARDIAVHMDGSRIFNASAATGIPLSRIVEPVDTVMCCLSKGLAAPVGSLLLGESAAIARARTYRRLLGGGWRQAGVLAGAGLVALQDMQGRLHEDHANAKRLADGLARIPGVRIDLKTVATNIVIFDIAQTGLSTGEFVSAMRSYGILVSLAGRTRVRMVTHLGITAGDCDAALMAVTRTVSADGAPLETRTEQ